MIVGRHTGVDTDERGKQKKNELVFLGCVAWWVYVGVNPAFAAGWLKTKRFLSSRLCGVGRGGGVVVVVGLGLLALAVRATGGPACGGGGRKLRGSRACLGGAEGEFGCVRLLCRMGGGRGPGEKFVAKRYLVAVDARLHTIEDLLGALHNAAERVVGGGGAGRSAETVGGHGRGRGGLGGLRRRGQTGAAVGDLQELADLQHSMFWWEGSVKCQKSKIKNKIVF